MVRRLVKARALSRSLSSRLKQFIAVEWRARARHALLLSDRDRRAACTCFASRYSTPSRLRTPPARLGRGLVGVRRVRVSHARRTATASLRRGVQRSLRPCRGTGRAHRPRTVCSGARPARIRASGLRPRGAWCDHAAGPCGCVGSFEKCVDLGSGQEVDEASDRTSLPARQDPLDDGAVLGNWRRVLKKEWIARAWHFASARNCTVLLDVVRNAPIAGVSRSFSASAEGASSGAAV